MVRTVASPGTFGCLMTAVSFINVPRLLIRLIHYGLWFTPPHPPFVHQREKAPRLPALAGSREREARSDRFTGGKLGTPNHPRFGQKG